MKTFKRFLTLILITTLAVSAWAVPAYRGWQERTLADGTPITIRQIGDEFYHFWETEDGKIALEQEDGTFVLSEEGRPTGEQIASRRKMARMFPSKSRKAIGDLNLAPRGLVILVQFSGSGGSFQSGNDKTAMTNMLNQEGYNYDDATGSAVDYFKAQSNNSYAPIFDVVGPVTLDNNLAYYGAQGTIAGYSQNDMYIADFVIDAVTKAEAAGCDFSKYDGDGDGYVDIVYFIYAGKGQADGGGTNTIWPHNWELASALWYGTTHGGSGYSYSNLPRFDTKRINNYACSGELNGSGGRSGIGTLCHEFSHVLGLPDYYVTDDEAANSGKKYTPGAWSIMDYGSYNNDGKTPPNYSPHDKLYFNWSTPEFLAKDAKKNCTLTTTYGSAYQITGTTTSAGAKSSSRVWYLEYRKKSGWDKYLPGHGMVVWEVQYNSTNWTNNTPNNSSVGYTLVTANTANNQNPRPYEPCVYNTTASSTSGTPFPGTSNVTSYTPATGCALTNITESSNDITFKYNGGEDKTRAAYEFVTDHCTAPADGDVAINAALSVTITPNSGYTLDDASCWTVEMGGVTLTYGSGFTYNASTNTFYIASLTDDVVIMAEAKLIRTVTWSVQGSTSATTFADGAALVLPSQPEDCSGTGGKKFVGWTANSSVSGSAPADLFTKASGVVTADATYYAVYATASTSGSGSTITLDATTDTSFPKDGITLTTSSGVLNNGTDYRIYKGATLTITSSVGDMSSIAFTFDGSYNGGGWATSYSPNASSWTSPACTSGTSGKQARITQIVVTIGSGGGSTTYSDYSLTCGAPVVCALTGITLNTSGATTTFTTGDTFSSAGLVVTAHYSNCADATVTPTSISSPDMSTAGTKTITVSYTENETTETETYTITVSDPATHTVTWSVQGNTSTTTFADGASLVVPSPQPSDCSGTDGKIFVGWTAHSTVDGSEPDDLFLVPGTKTVTADITYYAVYADDDVTSGGGAFDGDTEGYYKIYAEVGGTKYYAMGTGSKISSTTNEADATEYTFTKVSGGWTIQNGTTYITYSGSTNLGTSTSAYTWTLSEGSHGSWRVASGTNSSRAWIYRAGSVNKFGGYSTSNVNGTEYFDLEIGGGSSSVITYSDYSLTCTDTPPVPTYTVTYMACGAEFTTQTYSEGDPLVLPNPAPEDNAGKSFAGWTTSEHYTGAEAPTLISAGSAVNADATYYAVFH